MYAIKSKKTNRWFQGINHTVGKGSSRHLLFDEEIPALFKSRESARIELLSDCLNENAYEIIEVCLHIKEEVPACL